MKRTTAAWLNLGVKVALVALLLHAVVFPDLPQYQGKGIGWRLLLYPVSAVLVPAVWAVLGRRRASWAYPHVIDLCAALPFTIDTAGNAANLYDTVDWWDDVMHFVTWVPWVVAFGLALRYARSLTRWVVFGLTVGFGATTHIIWELLEYVAFIRGNPNEYESAYRDTMGDLTLSLSGSLAGAAIVATVLWQVGRPRPAD
jgi:GNAT superfamily N-acetyltransferase